MKYENQIMRALSLSVLLALVAPFSGAQILRHKAFTHATDCTGLLGKKLGQFCFELDSGGWFVCKPTSGDCDTAGEWIQIVSAGSEWTDTGTTLHPTEIGDDVVLGATSPVSSAKLSVDGDMDQIQALIQGVAGQTADYFVVEESDGADIFVVDAVDRRVESRGVSSANILIKSTGADSFARLALENDVSKWNISALGTSTDDLVFTESFLGIMTIQDGGPANAMFIEDTGDIGLGTATPETDLHVSESTTDTVPTVEIEQLSTGDAALQFSIVGDAFAVGIDNTDDTFKVSYAAGAGTAVLGTNDFLTITDAGLVSIGGVTPDGTLHVHTATAGSVTANTVADDLVVENSADGGLSILVPDASTSNVFLGSPTDSAGAIFRWQHSTLLATVGSAAASGELRFMSGDFVEAVRIESDQDVVFLQQATMSDILSITPKATAPATCTAATDFYTDTSGAACFCATTDTWEKLNATGTCA